MSTWSDYLWGTSGSDIAARTPTDNSGTALTGEAWTQVGGGKKIVLTGSRAAKIFPSSTHDQGLYFTNFAPAAADCSVQATFAWTAGTAPIFGLMLRGWQSGGITPYAFGYLLYYTPATGILGGTGNWVLARGGGKDSFYFSLASIGNSLDLSTAHTIKLTTTGQNPTVLSAYADGSSTPFLQFTDYADLGYRAAGNPGLLVSGALTSILVSAYQAGDVTSGDVAIAIKPTSVQLYQGQQQLFAATVSNTPNTSVTWSVLGGGAGGSVTSDGLYTAPPGSTGTDTVRATSVADSSKHADATVTVLAGNPYSLPGTTITEASTPAEQMRLRAHLESRLTTEVQSELWYQDRN